MIQGIVSLHRSDTTIQEIVGVNKSGDANVYPVYVPAGECAEDQNFVTAQITGTTPTQGSCPSELDQVAFDVICYAGDYEVMDSLANASRLVIDGYKGSVSGVVFAAIRFLNQVDSIDETTGHFARVMSYNAGVRRQLNKPDAMG